MKVARFGGGQAEDGPFEPVRVPRVGPSRANPERGLLGIASIRMVRASGRPASDVAADLLPFG